jgi:hypothetical protein
VWLIRNTCGYSVVKVLNPYSREPGPSNATNVTQLLNYWPGCHNILLSLLEIPSTVQFHCMSKVYKEI